MGIPKFYRWLSERYPLINQRLDSSHEFDNFYLDMNGIIHQCTHPNDDEIVVMNQEQMFQAMFDYTDRLYKIVRPRKLMYLAVDGVAPRAKMNQQRARRFRSSKDAERAVAEQLARGAELPEGQQFDSNCITPGTEFMADLSWQFRKWIRHKYLTDPAWQQGCDVIWSGPNVPGEGEHKIMDHIRTWRESKNWNPSVRHCMYGLDADLIMLGLVTHEPHFTLLREKMRWKGRKRVNPVLTGSADDADEFELLEIALLRDMLYLEFKPQPAPRSGRGGGIGGDDDGVGVVDPRRGFTEPIPPPPPPRRSKKMLPKPKPPPPLTEETAAMRAITLGSLTFKYEAHRIVDDFVFMCMLVGNDFVPHLPNLDIGEGALNLLFRVYKELLPQWRGYLTKAHQLHPDRLEHFLERIAETEVQHFENRAFEEEEPGFAPSQYKQFYYETKLNRSHDDAEFVDELCRHYLEGLHWVLQYYHKGCQSWTWFFPHLYAPLASDLKNLRSHTIKFRKGRPFRPVVQLLAVLPPASAPLLPKQFAALMKPTSPIGDFYPIDFEVDLNGKKNAWEAVVKIPFIDEKRLLKETDKTNPKKDFQDRERQRNKVKTEHVWRAQDFPHCDEYIPPVRSDRHFAYGRSQKKADAVRAASRRFMEQNEGVRETTRRPRPDAYYDDGGPQFARTKSARGRGGAQRRGSNGPPRVPRSRSRNPPRSWTANQRANSDVDGAPSTGSADMGGTGISRAQYNSD
ncbi:5'-3' exoribonuclease 2-like [Porphyridium purpureum]|uniref:5'-3' exoribonuclease n=1 Tax=Porphyridium purpureum TaxID=35688 RepID=A0A5J4YW09_PORPP|nr:5'-3' exoribonuclease 2-like [Porphyridium purpureum]|eukprot:POR1837..scf227_4